MKNFFQKAGPALNARDLQHYRASSQHEDPSYIGELQDWYNNRVSPMDPLRRAGYDRNRGPLQMGSKVHIHDEANVDPQALV